VANPALTYDQCKEVVDCFNQCLKEGFKYRGAPSAIAETGKRLGIHRNAVWSRLHTAERQYQLVADKPERAPYDPANDLQSDFVPKNMPEEVRGVLKAGFGAKTLAEIVNKTQSDTARVLDALDVLAKSGVNILRTGDRFEISKSVPAAYLRKAVLELTSTKENTFKIGVVSDNHCGSKYERRDVLNDLYDKFYEEGITQVLHAGNWIDGDARFNRHDLIAHGIEQQCQLLAETYPRRDGITTYAVWGDDHEGWYSQREGIDVGSYAEGVMRKNGREDWVNLGFMEAPIPLVNANSGVRVFLALVHPGGGSSYALSYAIQKIIESLEGGEKPAVGIYGHLHKLWAGNIRNVWCLITGCCQDQTPFMRKNKLEAHVAGTIVSMEQDPETGVIVKFCPDMRRYFAKGFYDGPRWSHHGPVSLVERGIG
jgi:predicted phosphodiesterase